MRDCDHFCLCGTGAASNCHDQCTDSQFDCAGVAREFEANESSVIAINKEKSGADAKNIVFGVTGAVLFWPALFLMDPKSPERVEIEALRNRNLVLTDIARTKG
ncbi:hypothetical protein CU102_02665 [Phyllobacterium brassicacearum]|uniref:Uncharacterized protein n=1 Tax=Phyllobacterium brassicacearum TaxID=314235 RepID=A0A2P7BWZ6_9HYPH|nr:hypothetical protein CU102_02665 [Phyllobacterium brassicacearum]